MNKTTLTAEPDKPETVIEREFDAPRELVFQAHTDPELYKQWLGPIGLETKFMEMEAKSGGSYRFTQRDEAGHEFGFHGVYHEILPPERIIGTFEFEGFPETGHVSLEKSVFEELPDDRTKVISRSLYFSVKERDEMLADGEMEKGVAEGYERLDEVLEKMKSI